MRLHFLLAYTLITLVQNKEKNNHKMHCTYMYCKYSIIARQEGFCQQKKSSLLNGDYLDISGVELGEK